MKKLLTIALILCSVTGFAQMRGGSQYDPGAVRANLTNITSGSALGVANGGTGKTTAAEGLAALGGASLNGSSTVDFLFKNASASGMIQIGATESLALNNSATSVYTRKYIVGTASTTIFAFPSGCGGFMSVHSYDNSSGSDVEYHAMVYFSREGTENAITAIEEKIGADNAVLIQSGNTLAISTSNAAFGQLAITVFITRAGGYPVW